MSAIAINEGMIREFLAAINAQAAKAGAGLNQRGYLQLVTINPGLAQDGEREATDDRASAQRFVIGDVDGMTRAAVIAAETGQNVYVEPRVLLPTASRKGRGK